MTNKPIITEGVDVSECEYFEARAQVMQCHMGSLTQRCKGNNCYYKQLKAQEQENEELKRELMQYEKDVKDLNCFSMKLIRTIIKIKEIIKISEVENES